MAGTLDRHNLYKELEALINQKKHNETDCGKYLQHTNNILFKKDSIIDPDKIKYVPYRGALGISDYVFVTRVQSDEGYECTRAYIWELKAPQCYIFQEDERTDSRVMPSQELITAENQLLHYHHDNASSGVFREAFGDINPHEIKIGGIIIGSNRTKVLKKTKLKKMDQECIETLYIRACRVREKLYSCCQLRLLNWDVILQQLKDPIVGKNYAGDPGTLFDPSLYPDTPIEFGSHEGAAQNL